MKKRELSMLYLVLISLMIGCSSSIESSLHGFYQSGMINGYRVQMLFTKKDNNFIEYIDNREVNKGSYEYLSNNKYRVNGDIQSFEFILEEDNSFDIAISKLNNNKFIKMRNLGNESIYFGTKFDDIEKYKKLLY